MPRNNESDLTLHLPQHCITSFILLRFIATPFTMEACVRPSIGQTEVKGFIGQRFVATSFIMEASLRPNIRQTEFYKMKLHKT